MKRKKRGYTVGSGAHPAKNDKRQTYSRSPRKKAVKGMETTGLKNQRLTATASGEGKRPKRGLGGKSRTVLGRGGSFTQSQRRAKSGRTGAGQKKNYKADKERTADE